MHLKMYGLAYLTAASPQPGSSFSADGEVSLTQGLACRAQHTGHAAFDGATAVTESGTDTDR